jgi:hypothetical protein
MGCSMSLLAKATVASWPSCPRLRPEANTCRCREGRSSGDSLIPC